MCDVKVKTNGIIQVITLNMFQDEAAKDSKLRVYLEYCWHGGSAGIKVCTWGTGGTVVVQGSFTSETGLDSGSALSPS